MHISLYALGDKYDIPTLCSHAFEQFDKLLRPHKKNLTLLLQLVPYIYESTSSNHSDMRNFAIKHIVLQSKGIFEDEDYKDTFLDLVGYVEGFRDDICLGFLKAAANGGVSSRIWYDRGRHTNFQVTCRGQVSKCHKLVLGTQSKVFEAACYNDFKESNTSEIDLSVDDPSLVGLMLEFLYTQDYALKAPQPPDSDGLQFIPKIHAFRCVLGDKYDLPELRMYSLNKLMHWLSTYGDAADSLAFTRWVYRALPLGNRAIHRSLLGSVVRSYRYIIDSPENAVTLQELCMENRGFAGDPAMALPNNSSGERKEKRALGESMGEVERFRDTEKQLKQSPVSESEDNTDDEEMLEVDE
ncbi:MAG: hypothetical protein Q9218_004242 [Villophora microphyllina]